MEQVDLLEAATRWTAAVNPLRQEKPGLWQRPLEDNAALMHYHTEIV